MDIGEVLGTVTCSAAAPLLADICLKVVRIYSNGLLARIAVAGGAADVGNGEFVYLISSHDAAKAFGIWPETVDYAVIGRVEDMNPEFCSGRLS